MAQPAVRALAVAALVFNAFTWGVSWWPFRTLQSEGLHPLWVTAVTFWAAVAVLLASRPQALGMLWRERPLWVLVLAAGATNACFNWAVTIGDVLRVVLLFYLMPLWAVLLARLLLGERITAAGMLRVLLALVGAAVVLWPSGDGTATAARSASALPLAEALALLGGFSFALNNVMLRREAHRDESARALAMFAGGAVVATLLALLLSNAGQTPWPPPPAPGWMLGVLGLAALFLASNLALQYGAAKLPANTTALVMLTEVVFASASALALGAGVLDWRLALGALLIVGAAVMAALQRG